jgi:hypothetical protein
MEVNELMFIDHLDFMFWLKGYTLNDTFLQSRINEEIVRLQKLIN